MAYIGGFALLNGFCRVDCHLFCIHTFSGETDNSCWTTFLHSRELNGYSAEDKGKVASFFTFFTHFEPLPLMGPNESQDSENGAKNVNSMLQ